MKRNQHIVFLDNQWCVHREGTKDIETFPDRKEAIIYAQLAAQKDLMEALLHREDGSIETAWIYALDAYPQAAIHKPEEYPRQEFPGDEMI